MFTEIFYAEQCDNASNGSVCIRRQHRNLDKFEVQIKNQNYCDLPVGFNPPVFDGAIPAKPNAAKLANGFFVKPLI